MSLVQKLVAFVSPSAPTTTTAPRSVPAPRRCAIEAMEPRLMLSGRGGEIPSNDAFVSISGGGSMQEETADSVTFTVNTGGRIDHNGLTVTLAWADEGDITRVLGVSDPEIATRNVDFSGGTTQVFIPAGQGFSAPITITAIDDSETEVDDRGTATVSDDVGLTDYLGLKVTDVTPQGPTMLNWQWDPNAVATASIQENADFFYTGWHVEKPADFDPNDDSVNITTVVEDSWTDVDNITRVETYYYRDYWVPMFEHSAQSIDWGEDAVLTFGAEFSASTTFGVDFGIELGAEENGVGGGVSLSISGDWTFSTSVSSSQTVTAQGEANHLKSVVMILQRRDFFKFRNYVDSTTGAPVNDYQLGLYHLTPTLTKIASGWTGQRSAIIYANERFLLDPDDNKIESLFLIPTLTNSPNRGGPDPVLWTPYE